MTGHILDRWSCGRNKKIIEGDRLFLIRQGRKPRGIFGSGWAASGVFDDQHWDDDQRLKGRRALYVDVDFDALLDPDHEPILSRAELSIGTLADMRWDSRISGIVIPDEIARMLEVEWAQLLALREKSEWEQEAKQ